MSERRNRSLQEMADYMEVMIFGKGKKYEKRVTSVPAAQYFLLHGNTAVTTKCRVCGCPLSREECDRCDVECFSCFTIGKELD